MLLWLEGTLTNTSHLTLMCLLRGHSSHSEVNSSTRVVAEECLELTTARKNSVLEPGGGGDQCRLPQRLDKMATVNGNKQLKEKKS